MEKIGITWLFLLGDFFFFKHLPEEIEMLKGTVLNGGDGALK